MKQNLSHRRLLLLPLLGALSSCAPAQNAAAPLGADEFAAAMKEPKACVVDMRPAAKFGESHIAGAVNVGLRAGASDWLRRVLPADCRPLLILQEDIEATSAAEQFTKAELPAPRFLRGGLNNWKGETVKLPQKNVGDLKKALDAKENVIVLDVRSNEEWNAGHIRGARHFVLNDLVKTTPDLPKDTPVAVICQSGYRSSIAASILKSRGFTTLSNVSGGMGAWQAAGHETVKDK